MTREEAARRSATVLQVARELYSAACADATVSGATVMLPDGSTFFMSVRETAEMLAKRSGDPLQ